MYPFSETDLVALSHHKRNFWFLRKRKILPEKEAEPICDETESNYDEQDEIINIKGEENDTVDDGNACNLAVVVMFIRSGKGWKAFLGLFDSTEENGRVARRSL